MGQAPFLQNAWKLANDRLYKHKCRLKALRNSCTFDQYNSLHDAKCLDCSVMFFFSWHDIKPSCSKSVLPCHLKTVGLSSMGEIRRNEWTIYADLCCCSLDFLVLVFLMTSFHAPCIFRSQRPSSASAYTGSHPVEICLSQNLAGKRKLTTVQNESFRKCWRQLTPSVSATLVCRKHQSWHNISQPEITHLG